MDRRVAQGPAAPGPRADRPTHDIGRSDPDVERAGHWLDLVPSVLVGAGLFLFALWVYWWPGNERIYDHFVWQALAFLDGRAAIDWPVPPGPGTPGNWYFQDVMPVVDEHGAPAGQALLPFPPLPALVLLPVVALYGVATDEQAVSVVLGAAVVVLCWWMLGRLRIRRDVRLVTTLFFAFGTVFWYAAQLGTTWFFAHVVALAALFPAVALALEADPEADEGVESQPGPRGLVRDVGVWLRDGVRRPGRLLDGRQVLAGLLFGVAATARLPILLAAPFFVFVGGGGTWVRRAASAGLGAILPVSLLFAYNVAATGQVFHPAYDYQYELETYGWPALDYHDDWAIEDPRYLPQNIGIAFLSPPVLFPEEVPLTLGGGRPLCLEPEATRGLFDFDCPIALPRDTGMSLFLTSPAILLGLAVRRRLGWSRLVSGAFAAILGVVLVDLMHFSQGWVQFGWRFSNDLIAFVLPLVALGIDRLGRDADVARGDGDAGPGTGGVGWLAVALIAISMAVNHWGVTWGNELGW